MNKQNKDLEPVPQLPLSIKHFSRIKKTLTKFLYKWQTRVGLCQWYIEPSFTVGSDSDNTDGRSACAKVNTMWEYQKAYITFFIPEVIDYNDEQLEKCVLHELCHVLVHEMRCWNPKEDVENDVAHAGLQHEERVVTQLTNALWWSYEDGFNDGVKGLVEEINGPKKNNQRKNVKENTKKNNKEKNK